ncbi:LysR family transcriptional regulator [Paenibacillus sp. NPDC058071]|uniref:LysR family transcriptional regulator n=1 Tax=Paenibacillus sp. NPDC058071 TaxID=3346326 RepID=UPI0036DEBE4A
MTLTQLKYVIEVANKGSITDAAKSLFISQPSLSAAIKELEEELRINIFVRTNRGIIVTNAGAEFLGHARQIIQQTELVEEKYLVSTPSKQRFAVSTQHYTFTVNAFVDLIKEYGADEYDFTLRETKTFEIIEDVKNLKSELGVIYLSTFNEPIIRKFLKESNLVFSELFSVRPHIFISKQNPLALKSSVSLKDLEEFPCLSFEQGEQNSFYFSEEILSTLEHKKSIKVTDRAAVNNLLIGVNAYIIATGVFPSLLHGDDITAVPLEVDEIIQVGTITHKDYIPSRLGEIYLSALRRIANNLSHF